MITTQNVSLAGPEGWQGAPYADREGAGELKSAVTDSRASLEELVVPDVAECESREDAADIEQVSVAMAERTTVLDEAHLALQADYEAHLASEHERLTAEAEAARVAAEEAARVEAEAEAEAARQAQAAEAARQAVAQRRSSSGSSSVSSSSSSGARPPVGAPRAVAVASLSSAVESVPVEPGNASPATAWVAPSPAAPKTRGASCASINVRHPGDVRARIGVAPSPVRPAGPSTHRHRAEPAPAN